jgi:vacuolar iron transporter family protein
VKLLSKYLPQVVYGSVDGTVTTFAIVSGVVGASLSPIIVVILGISNVLADGFSMAASNYLSMQTETHSTKRALYTSYATFIAFVCMGSVPVLPFVIASFVTVPYNLFTVSCVMTAGVFVTIGFISGRLNKTNPWRRALETLAIGAIAAGIAYGVGAALRTYIGIS